jgi:hypothetical protein
MREREREREREGLPNHFREREFQGENSKKEFTLKMFDHDATWHFEISDCVLSPQAYYLH